MVNNSEIQDRDQSPTIEEISSENEISLDNDCDDIFDSVRHGKLDVSSAFLHARFKEMYYYHLPVGHPYKTDGNNLCYVSAAAANGHPEANRAWNGCVVPVFDELGLEAIPKQPCLFYHKNQNGLIDFLALLYVDDILFAGTNRTFEKKFLKKLYSIFKCRHSFEVKKFLGVNINFLPTGAIKLTMKDHIEELCAKYNITKEQAVEVPMYHNFHLFQFSTPTEHKSELFNIFGVILYLAEYVRVDIQMQINTLCQHLANPTKEAYDGAIQILKYCIGISEK